MQAKLLPASLIICALIFLNFITQTAYSDDPKDRVDYYESCIVKKIKKCDSMFVMLSSSKSENLREYARLEAQKAAFLDNEKEMLVKEMIEIRLEPKQYKVDLFLNSRFQRNLQYTQ